ncbi:MAG TPA: VWA domain-containing protein [Burkholderiales bacterium]
MQLPSLTQAWPLWLLTLLPLLWFAALRHRTRLSRWRMTLAVVLRSLALTALVVALTEPLLPRTITDISVVYALDVSHSVAPAFVQGALDWMRQANKKGAPAQARYVVFANRPRLLNSLEDIESVSVTGDAAPSRSAIGQNATDLELALDMSAFGFAPNHAKRLVLMTDGNATDGDVWRALPRLQVQGVRIFALPAPAAVTNDAWIETVDLPEGVRQQEPARLRVRVYSRTKCLAHIQMSLNGDAVARQKAMLRAGENEIVFTMQFKRQGANTVAVEVAADGDRIAENDALSQTFWIGPRARILYVESNPETAHYLRDALHAQGIDVTVAGTEGFGARLKGQDAVLLSDIPAEKFDPATVERLEAFVREGGGLVFAAGENTYGAKGFARSRMERVLPVKFEAQRKRKELDLVLLIDRSFSMRGQKLEFAKSAALSTLDLLDEHHRLAVIAFDSRPHEVVPLAEVGNKQRAEDLISGMSASGQTNIYNALWHAYRLLENSAAKTRHVILLSDGNTAPPGRLVAETSSRAAMALIRKERGLPPEQEFDKSLASGGIDELAAQFNRANITLSTVAVGENPDLELMARLAHAANGTSHVAESETQIPSLFVTEAKRLLGESIVEEPFRPVVRLKTEALADVDFERGPELKGFVLGQPKRFAEVVLEAKDHQALLVRSHYGLGESIAFLSDVKNRWAVDWLAWPGYGKLWAQVVRESMRRDTGEELALRVAREGHSAVVTLTALTPEGKYRDDIAPKVRMSAPDATSAVSQLRQIGPGKYQARIALQASTAGSYVFDLVDTPGLTPQALAQTGTRSLFYGYSDEYRDVGPNIGLLRALCERTGGKFAPQMEDVFARQGDGGVVSKPLWRYFAAIGLALFLLDVALRRISGRR